MKSTEITKMVLRIRNVTRIVPMKQRTATSFFLLSAVLRIETFEMYDPRVAAKANKPRREEIAVG
jgi:hypothetical protein